MIPTVSEKAAMVILVLVFAALAWMLRSPIPLIGALLVAVLFPVVAEFRVRAKKRR